jgi:hypothetical protein
MSTEKRSPPFLLATIVIVAMLLLLVDRDEFGSYFSPSASSGSSVTTKQHTFSSKNKISATRGGDVLIHAGTDDDDSMFAKILAQHLDEAESEIAALVRAKLNLTSSSTRGGPKKNESNMQEQQKKTTAHVSEAFLGEIGRLEANLATGAFKESGDVATITSADNAEVNSATGTLFKGEIIRTFTGDSQFAGNWQQQPSATAEDPSEQQQPSCSKWGVVTTIYDPSLAIARAADMDGWCLVIVADTIVPKDYLQKAGLETKKDTVVFFSVQDQQQWIKATDEVGDFTRAVPFKHFARKNLGYLYAIRHGAHFIFDFDDDNIVYKSNAGKVVPIIPNEKMVEHARVVSVGPSVFNPYPLMNSSSPTSWPRGFPLESIQNVSTQGVVMFEKDAPMDKVGVIQFCAESNPDIDAIHRLVKPLPMNFDQNTKPIIVPSHAFVPYNAQATIHTFPALWATVLPSTVPGRVSDIWRSYFAQCLFRDLDLAVVFAPPSIEQIRNAHN